MSNYSWSRLDESQDATRNFYQSLNAILRINQDGEVMIPGTLTSQYPEGYNTFHLNNMARDKFGNNPKCAMCMFILSALIDGAMPLRATPEQADPVITWLFNSVVDFRVSAKEKTPVKFPDGAIQLGINLARSFCCDNVTEELIQSGTKELNQSGIAFEELYRFISSDCNFYYYMALGTITFNASMISPDSPNIAHTETVAKRSSPSCIEFIDDSPNIAHTETVAEKSSSSCKLYIVGGIVLAIGITAIILANVAILSAFVPLTIVGAIIAAVGLSIIIIRSRCTTCDQAGLNDLNADSPNSQKRLSGDKNLVPETNSERTDHNRS